MADGEGAFTFTLDDPLPSGFGLRTTSTTQSLNVIPGMRSGMTTRNSILYLAVSDLSLTLPPTATVGANVPITITAGPANATLPMEYTIAATDLAPSTTTVTANSAGATLTWTEPGVKTVTVTVSNGLGTVTEGTAEITVAPARTGFTVYIPEVSR